MNNLIESIREERRKYGALMGHDDCALLCNAVAWRHRADGWGLSRKTGGTRGRLPNGVEIAHDILHHAPSNELVDILTAAGAESQPAWQPVGPPQSPDRTWVAPVDPASFGAAPVTPTPVAPPSSGPTNAEIMGVLRDIQVALDLISHNAREGALTALKTQNDLERGLSVSLNGNLFSKASGLARAQRG